MKKITLIALMLFTALGYAQVGINTNNPDASSALEIESTTAGILIPRLTQTQRDAISAPATGLMIYQTNGTSGFYFYDGNIWTKVDGVAGPQGTDGVDGLPGADGIDGTDGVDGVDGANGMNGTNGQDGQDGVDGAPGLTGAAGVDGTNGADGVDGLPGANGTDGVDGVDGAQGPIGLTGEAGIDGTNGSDGAQGIQGGIGAMQYEYKFDADIIENFDIGTNPIVSNKGLRFNININGATLSDLNGITVIHLFAKDFDGELPNNFLSLIKNIQNGTKGFIHLDNSNVQNSSTNGDDGLVFAITDVKPLDNIGQGTSFGIPPGGPLSFALEVDFLSAGNNFSTAFVDDANIGVDLYLSGPKGDTGAASTFPGPQGETGPAGVDGIDGTQGDTGVAGPQGDIGVTGSQGETGAAGIDGTNGSDGVDGAQGPAGADGNDGATGAAGIKTLINTSDEAAGDNCANGGVKIEVGEDANADGILDTDEIDDSLTSYVCEGIDGADGADGPIGFDGNSSIWKWTNADLGFMVPGSFNTLLGGQWGPATNSSDKETTTSIRIRIDDYVAVTPELKQWLLFCDVGSILYIRRVDKIQEVSYYQVTNVSMFGTSLVRYLVTYIDGDGTPAVGITDENTYINNALYYIGYTPSSSTPPAANRASYSNNTFYAELGGYVIEVNSEGTHGLVVAMQDQGTSNWYESDDLLSNASNHDTNGAKFKDWRLPTKRELNLVYGVFSNGNGANLNESQYWSSTENDNDGARRQYFANGSQASNNKTNTFSVRAVRAF